jgi:hypothetical protein
MSANRPRVRLRPVLAWLWLALPAVPAPAVAGDDPWVTFFEQRIRPVLVKECYSCHSAESKEIKGGLRLDTREAVLAGGDTGPAVVPGKPEESPLVEAIRYEGPEMPPKKKLPDAVVADFERWVRIGAPDPRAGIPAPTRAKTGIDVEARRSFWAYQQPRRHDAPAVADTAWPRTDVDRFVLAALEAEGLKPAADADRATLARRVFFDLVGLPPTPGEVDSFLADDRPDSYERLVDRLLASPGFGERWGRHWLDVVRYGDSITLRGMVFKSAWRYRDYVIDAFNADTPYDRFLREQVSGDLSPADRPLEERRRGRVATTFLALGNTNLEEQDKGQLDMDVVDEQLDTIGKAFLGQTLGCARCHDHKFDPIPTRDYYAMAGILRNTRTLEHANVSKTLEVPMPTTPEREAALAGHEKAVAALEAKIKEEKERAGKSIDKPSGVVAVKELPGVVVDDADARKVGLWTHSTNSRSYIGAGYVHDRGSEKGANTITFQPEIPATGDYEVWLAYSGGGGRAASVPVTVMSADGEKGLTVDMSAAPPIDGRFLSLGRYRCEKNGQAYVLVSNEGTAGIVTADAVVFLTPADAAAAARKQQADTISPLEAELKRLRETGRERESAMSVVEETEITDTRVHIRGSAHALGETVPRGFLRVATYGPTTPIPSNESGRREFAAWLASADNPLTARVLVNRAWHWLFGVGLVSTPDNFGTTGEPPSHPALLDDLAVRFMTEDRWSVKALVRRVVLSRTYRQSTAADPVAVAADPENRRLGRANRRRLDAECLRDTMLAVAGRLRTDMGGPTFDTALAVDYGYEHTDTRRSVYAPVFRNALPDLFEAFDFADPSLVVGRRNVSTVAPQALLLLNHPFVIDQARAAARRLLADPSLDDAGRVTRAYRLTLGREPTGSERAIAQRFVRDADADVEEAWATLVQSLFASLDFRYVN